MYSRSMKKILIASNNIHKTAEITSVLMPYFDKIFTPNDLGLSIDPTEVGKTFLENALIKARAFSACVDMPVLSDDTGLCVHCLNNLPGVLSARYTPNHDSKENRQRLLFEMQDAKDRKAHFETVAVLRFPDGKELIGKGRVDGEIMTQESKTSGFGYESIFFCTALQKPFSCASIEEKNLVSHRGQAVRSILMQLGLN